MIAKLLLPLLLGAVVVLGVVALTSGRVVATPAYTQQTGKPCNYCHTTPPDLNDQGKKFQANGHKL